MMSRTMGTYTLDESLGQSEHGSTYLARRKDVRAALKIYEVAANGTEQRAFIRDFQARAQTVSALYHPTIVPLRDYGVAENYLYAVSAFQAIRTLGDQMRTGGLALPMPIEIALTWITQLGDALHEIHHATIAHGNLKPNNIFIGEQDGDAIRLLLGDFALVPIHARSLIPPLGTQPTWDYTPPEYRTHPLSPAADQFALATIVFEWITGKTPFGGRVPTERGTALSAAQSNSALGGYPDLDGVFARAFALHPEQRYLTIGAFTRAISAALVSPTARETTPRQMPEPEDDLLDSFDTPAEPIQRQEMPSSWLLAGPSGDTNPGIQPPITKLSSQEFYAVQPPTKRRKDAAPHITDVVAPAQQRGAQPRIPDPKPHYSDPVLRVLGPSTREQELLAPQAMKQQQRPRAQRNNNITPPRQVQAMADEIDFPTPSTIMRAVVSRRSALIAMGKGIAGLLAGAAVVGGAKVAWDHITPLLNRPAQRQLPAHITLPPAIHLTHHTGPVNALAWSQDSKKLASGAADDGAIALWSMQDVSDATTPTQMLTSPEMAKGIASLSWARDNQALFAALVVGNGQFWRTTQTTPIAHVPYDVQLSQWHPAADVLALASATATIPDANGGKNVIIWDITTASSTATLTGHTDHVQALAWQNTTGFSLATGGADKLLFLWGGTSAATMAALTSGLAGHSTPITALAWSGQESRLVTASQDGMARLWNSTPPFDTQTLLVAGSPIQAVAWSPIFPLVALGHDNGSITFWDTNGRHRLATIIAGTTPVRSLAWSPDGHYLTAGTTDHQISVWDTHAL